MSTTVIARNRSRMYTAFTLDDGRHVLNVAVVGRGGQTCASIEMDEDDRREMAAGDVRADERAAMLVRDGRRLDEAVPTPPAGAPVTGIAAAA